MTPFRRSPRFGGAILALALCVSLAAQQPPQPTFRVEANFVRVDVYPTAGGRPVTDLNQDDFEVLEDGVRQRIETFEYIAVQPAGPQSTRIEPNTPRESAEMAADARSRVFVLFLDTYHVGVGGSHNIRQPLVRMLDRLIGQDDLVGVMTPEMSAANLVLARKTTTIEGMLTDYWTWGRRDDEIRRDPEERTYENCYLAARDEQGRPIGPELVRAMVERRREKLTFDALEDLVVHLRGIREERKAVVAISEGWRLFRPDQSLARPLPGQPVPGTPELGVGPTGKITTEDHRATTTGSSLYECDTDRMRLGLLDNDQQFRDLLDEANRSNASFYPVDPRGLVAFDSPIDRPLAPSADRAVLGARLDTLRTLAGATDGMAVVNSNDLEGGLKRIVADLSSYYLLGYYSTNDRLDGRFRSIKVRVRRPGVDVRARRGYRAATAAEVTAERPAAARGSRPAAPDPSPVDAALATLAAVRPDTKLHVHATYRTVRAPAADGTPAHSVTPATIWVVGELDHAVMRSTEWKGGAKATLSVTAGGATVASGEAMIPAGRRLFEARLDAPALTPGDYTLRVRASAPGVVLPLSSLTSIVVAEGSGEGPPLFHRRGPATANRYEPTADLRFTRNERLRIDVPIGEPSATATAAILDRRGQAIAVPVATSSRDDGEGGRWIVGEAALAPLAPGDYGLEVVLATADGERRVLTAFRVVP